MKKKILLSAFLILLLICTICFANEIPIATNMQNDANVAILTQFLIAYMGIMIIISIIAIIFSILKTVALCLIFEMAEESWWKALIPIYNIITLFKIVGMSPWLLLLYILAFIPFLNLILGPVISIILSIIVAIKLARAFGKSGAFAVGLILLGPIFYCILAFGDNRYELGDAKKADELFGDPNEEKEEVKKTKTKSKSKLDKYIIIDPETGEEIDPEFFKPMDLTDYKPKSDFFK